MVKPSAEWRSKTRIAVQVYNGLPFDTLEAAAQVAESSGYELLLVTEGPGGMETPPVIAAIAQSTSTIVLGTAVIPIFFRGAALMTQMASTLHNITHGRFILGLGTGHARDLWQEHAVAFERPFQRMREYVHVIREAMAQGHITYDGEVVKVPELRLPFPPQKPLPIYLAALGPQMAALAGEIADGVVFNMCTPEYLAEAISGLKEAACRAGRDPSQVEIVYNVLCAGDTSEAEWACRRAIGGAVRTPFYQNVLRHSEFGADVDKVIAAMKYDDPEKLGMAVSDRLLDALAVWGPPATWWEKVPRFQKAGATMISLRFRPSGPDIKETLLSGIRGFAEARNNKGT